MRPIGKRQYELLQEIASNQYSIKAGCRVLKSLIKRGLVVAHRSRGFLAYSHTLAGQQELRREELSRIEREVP